MTVIVRRAMSWLFAARNASPTRKAVVQRAGPQLAAALATPLAAALATPLAAALATPLAAALLAGVPPTPSAASSGAVPAARAAVPAAGSWGKAIEVPGLGG